MIFRKTLTQTPHSWTGEISFDADFYSHKSSCWKLGCKHYILNKKYTYLFKIFYNGV